MTDRDKLIKLLSPFSDGTYNGSGTIIDGTKVDDVVNSLLANGVIVPPIKVGQTVYVINGDEKDVWIDEFKVKYFYCSSKGVNRFYSECGTMGNNFRPKDIGKDVFLTKEDAEEKLKESKGNGI